MFGESIVLASAPTRRPAGSAGRVLIRRRARRHVAPLRDHDASIGPGGPYAVRSSSIASASLSWRCKAAFSASSSWMRASSAAVDGSAAAGRAARAAPGEGHPDAVVLAPAQSRLVGAVLGGDQEVEAARQGRGLAQHQPRPGAREVPDQAIHAGIAVVEDDASLQERPQAGLPAQLGHVGHGGSPVRPRGFRYGAIMPRGPLRNVRRDPRVPGPDPAFSPARRPCSGTGRSR